MEKSTHVVLAGSHRPVSPGATAMSRADADETIELTIKLRRISPLPEPGSGSSSPVVRSSFAAKYGASDEDIKKAETVLERFGLETVSENAAARSIRVSGSIEEIENAFQVKLFHYSGNRGIYRGRAGNIYIPEELDGIVEGVFGLDTRAVSNRRRSNPHAIDISGASKPAKHRSWFYSNELAKLYNFPAGDGSGQTIGIMEFGGGFFPNDLQQFCNAAGVGVPNVIPVSVHNTPTNVVDQKDHAEVEVMLDVEVVAGVCPKSTIVVYFCPGTSEQGWVDGFDTAIHDAQNNPSVISVSWGGPEEIWSAAGMNAINESLKAAATLGITVCVSSGDDGSDDQVGDGHAHVNFPASSPYVLAVGGTALKVKNNTIKETAWKQGDGLRADNGGASGGGISEFFQRPSWQDVTIPSVNPGAIDGRVLPDVAADASGATGYFVFADGQPMPGVGGTSASTPLWASLISLINASVGKNVGYLTPLLYQSEGSSALGSQVCNDITTGNNISSKGGGYSAKPGYDAVTGWGSPKGVALLTALKPKLSNTQQVEEAMA